MTFVIDNVIPSGSDRLITTMYCFPGNNQV